MRPLSVIINGDRDVSQYVQSFDLTLGFFDAAHSLSLSLFGLPLEATKSLREIQLAIGDDVLLQGDVWGRRTDGQGAVTLQASDYRQRFVQAYADPSLVVPPGITIKAALLKLLGPFGVHNVLDSTQDWKNLACPLASPMPAPDSKNLSHKVEGRTSHENQGAWQAAQVLCERAGLTMFPTGDVGTIALVRPSYDQSPTFQVLRTATSSNVEEAECTEDYSEACSLFVCTDRSFHIPGQHLHGLKKSIKPFQDYDLPARVKDIGSALYTGRREADGTIDLDRSLYLPRFVSAKECKTQDELDSLVRKEIGNSFRNTLALSYSFPDVELDEKCFIPDTIFSVQDEIFEIDDEFWCFGVNLRYSESSGPQARVQLIWKGAYL